MTGPQMSSGRRREARLGPQVVSSGSNATGFQNSLSMALGWLNRDVIYVFSFGRQNAVFNSPSGINTAWTQVYSMTVIGGAGVLTLWRTVATANGSGSVSQPRSGNSVGWSVCALVVRGASPTDPEDSPVSSNVRPGATSSPGTGATLAGVTPSRANCLAIVFADTDSGRIDHMQPLVKAVRNVGVHELRDAVQPQDYVIRINGQSVTANWAAFTVLVRPL